MNADRLAEIRALVTLSGLPGAAQRGQIGDTLLERRLRNMLTDLLEAYDAQSAEMARLEQTFLSTTAGVYDVANKQIGALRAQVATAHAALRDALAVCDIFERIVDGESPHLGLGAETAQTIRAALGALEGES